MRIQSELCHIEEDRVVVRVSAWENELNLGSTLAEGATATLAEENGIKQLLERLRLGEDLNRHYLEISKPQNEKNKIESIINQKVEAQTSNQSTQDSSTQKISSSKVSEKHPEDWSKELASIEFQIKKLSWSREEENKFLKDEFGVSDRNRITSYEILHSYLKRLEELNQTKISPDLINNKDLHDLLEESNLILRELDWDTQTARNFLSETMHVTSRQKLDVDGLHKFNKMLKSKLSN